MTFKITKWSADMGGKFIISSVVDYMKTITLPPTTKSLNNFLLAYILDKALANPC